MKRNKKKRQSKPHALPADSAARLPDTQAPRQPLPRSLAQPQSEGAVKQAKEWVDQKEM